MDRIENWLTRHNGSASERDFSLVLRAYEAIPDKDALAADTPCGTQRIPLTEDFVDRLRAHFLGKANFSIPLFLKRGDVPAGLTYATLTNILSGKTKSAKRAHYEFLNNFTEKHK